MTTTWRLALAAALISIVPRLALAQDTDTPATDAPPPATDTPPPAATDTPPPADTSSDADAELPPVEVVQEQVKPKKKAVKKKKQKIAKKKKPKPAPQPAPVQVQAPVEPQNTEPTIAEGRASGDLVPMSPAGGEIELRKVPGNVRSVSSAQIARSGRAEPQEALQKSVPGLVVTDTAGSSFRTQIEYRGFSAGSVTGFPQGFAVYQNGIRINEVFGDVVNFDLIPSNAINDMTIVSGNPVYGLNAVGGGISMLMKDGFSFKGVEIDLQGGAHGRKQVSTQVGVQSEAGNVSLYFAGQKIKEDGFRDFSPVDIERMYADLGFRGSAVEAHFNLTWADSSAGVVTAAPEELLNIDWSRTFTNPQITDLNVVMPSVNVKVKATDTLTFSGLAYYRRFKSNVIDGNLLGGGTCEPPKSALFLCDEDNQFLLDPNGNQITAAAVGNEPFGAINNIDQKVESFGATTQLVEKEKLLGLGNQFLAGASYDRGNVRYRTDTQLGTISDLFVVSGSGIFTDDARDIDSNTEYIGLYFSDTLDLTDELALTVGGRWNHATIDLTDLTGNFPGLTGSNTFEHFNPSVGATYEALPGLTLYGGYSKANRAPTPAELGCANPDNPCVIESFLTDDPPLEQVITDTWEAGLRGKMRSPDGEQNFNWSVGWFRALNSNDILFVSSNVTGLGFFLNGGDTLRQGIEVSAKYNNSWLSLYAGYSYVKATFETPNEFISPNNPAGVPCSGDPTGTCINVTPGDNIPGIPNHRFKTGFDYSITDNWTFGADLIAASGQYHLGDESNLLPQVGGYTRVDIKSSYHLNDHVEIYGFVNNVFDRRYGLFGTLFDTQAASDASTEGIQFSNPRSITPAQPVSAYGGVKMKF